MNEDMKFGYNVFGQGMIEEIDTMINELNNAFMRSTDTIAKVRLDSKMKILWIIKDKVENALADITEVE